MMFDVLIIAPEITKGMKSIGPKALLKIKNSTAILDHQILQLKNISGLRHIYISVGFEGDKIKKSVSSYKDVKIINNSEYQTTNQTKSILLYLDSISKPTNLLIISNGILFKGCFSDCGLKTSKIYLIDKPKPNFNIGCHDTSTIQYLFYDFPLPWSECAMLNIEALEMLKNYSVSHNINQNFLFETINILISENITFDKIIIPKTKIMKISSIKDMQKAKLFV
jgi:hypothetical protein